MEVSRGLSCTLVFLTAGASLLACDLSTAPPTLPLQSTVRGLVGCGNVTFQGCCDGQTVWFCKSKKLQKLSCAKTPKCGWSSTYNLYDCGTDGKSDPAGKHLMSCATAFGDAGPPSDGPKADGPGADAGQQDASAKDTAAAADIKLQPDSGGCGAMTQQGCCDGNSLWYCDAGKVKTINCGYNPKCGWDAKASVYDCGTLGKASPSGKHPMPCAAVVDGGVASTDAQTADSAPVGDAGLGCGTLTIEGCCDGHTVWYCSDGKAQHYSCAKSPKCGWNPLAKWYLCKTNGGADPGGKFPRPCKGLLWDGGPPSTDTGPPELGPDMPWPDLPEPDVFQTPDVGSDVTVDSTADTGADVARPDSGASEEEEGSCGCAVGPRGGALAWPLLLGVLFVIARRRRERSSKG